MPSIVTDKFRISNAALFRQSFNDSSFYALLGRPVAWTDDNAAPMPADTFQNVDFDFWRQVYGGKLIGLSDTTHSINRHDWVEGEVYDQYRDNDAALLTKDFYVITDDFNVYKCIYNREGIPSEDKPTGTGTAIFTTSDGYKWKFMYTIAPADANKFVTPQFHPVKTLTSDDGSTQWTVQQAAIPGTIDSITQITGGSGYTTASVAIVGDGTGAAATATIGGGVVTRVTITNPGSGYTWATVSITGDGSAATYHANIAPRGGHGADPIAELGGYYVSASLKFQYDEGGLISTSNEFRQVVLIKNPYDYGTTDIATTGTIRQTLRLTVTAASDDFTNDEIVEVDDENRGVVVEWDSANNFLYLTDVVGEFSNADGIEGVDSGSTATVSAVSNPGLEPYTGEFFYIEQRSPVSRAEDQIEQIILTVEF